MCKYFSCLVTRKREVLWDKFTTSHEDLVRKHKLKDDKLINRDFVRIEIIPKDINEVTKKKTDWIYKIDEDDTLPKWYIKNKGLLKDLCFKAWKDSIKQQCAFGNEVKEIEEGLGFAYDSSTVTAYSSSTVTAYSSSTVKACDSSIIIKSKFYEGKVKQKNQSIVVTRGKPENSEGEE